jgi:hypothetical protein
MAMGRASSLGDMRPATVGPGARSPSGDMAGRSRLQGARQGKDQGWDQLRPMNAESSSDRVGVGAETA